MGEIPLSYFCKSNILDCTRGIPPNAVRVKATFWVKDHFTTCFVKYQYRVKRSLKMDASAAWISKSFNQYRIHKVFMRTNVLRLSTLLVCDTTASL